MSDFSHLVSSKVNLALLQEQALNDLIDILDRCEGTKVKFEIFTIFSILSKFLFNFNKGFDVG
jgi:hypothetical protein